MLSIVKSMALHGLEGYLISVQVDISSGIPSWEIVGLPDTCVKESKDRVKIAIQNSGFEFRSKKIIVNLAPAMKRKEGTSLDLPIAMGILASIGFIKNNNLEDTIFIGELSLDGTINKVNGVLPICIEALKLGIKRIVMPIENIKEASIIKGIEYVAERNLEDVIKYINGDKEKNHIYINNVKTNCECYNIDFSDVKGQKSVKRAVEVAACGGHNLLLTGIPGSGKTMIARRIPTILPKLTFDESIEVTKIHSIIGLLKDDEPIIKNRPFRSPHYTISPISLIGGRKNPKTWRNKFGS